jgi:hypothetical protein
MKMIKFSFTLFLLLAFFNLNGQDSIGIKYTPIRGLISGDPFIFKDSLRPNTYFPFYFPPRSTESITPTPIPPKSWQIDYPNGFKGKIIVTIPNTDSLQVKTHFIYRNGQRTKLVIRKKKYRSRGTG